MFRCFQVLQKKQSKTQYNKIIESMYSFCLQHFQAFDGKIQISFSNNIESVS